MLLLAVCFAIVLQASAAGALEGRPLLNLRFTSKIHPCPSRFEIVPVFLRIRVQKQLPQLLLNEGKGLHAVSRAVPSLYQPEG